MRCPCRTSRAQCSRLGWTLAFVAAMAAAPVAAATITVSVRRGAQSLEVEASTTLQADVATAWRVLSDYDRYAEFIADLQRSRVVARRGSSVTVEQSGFARVWLLKLPIEVTFEVEEHPPHWLQSRAVAGSLRSLTSRYVLTPAGAGTRLDYRGQIAPGFDFFARIEQAVVEHNIARQFQALADEIERQGAPARAQAGEGMR